MVATGAIVAINGLNPLSLLAMGVSGVWALFPKISSKNQNPELSNQNGLNAPLPLTAPTTENIPAPEEKRLAGVPPVVATSGAFKIYRQAELKRTTASLLASSAILIAGEEGSGKSVLANAVVEKLSNDGFIEINR